MDNPPPRTERSLRERQAEATRRMRRAEWTAYAHGALALVAYVAFATSGRDWVAPLYVVVLAAVLVSLGYLVGRRRSAPAAAGLVVVVLGMAVVQTVGGGRPPVLIVVAFLAWTYGRAYAAAREYATLKVVPLEADASAA